MFSELQLLNFFLAYVNFMSFIGYIISCMAYKRYKKVMPLGYMLLLTFVSDNLQQYLIQEKIASSFTVYHFFNPLQFILLCWFFYINFENPNVKKAVIYIAIITTLFAPVNTLFLQSLDSNPSNFIITETLLLIILSIMLFIENLDAPASVNIFKNPVFISASAILLFNIFSFISALLIDYFLDHNLDAFRTIFRLLYFANFIFYGLLLIANVFSLKKIPAIEKSRI